MPDTEASSGHVNVTEKQPRDRSSSQSGLTQKHHGPSRPVQPVGSSLGISISSLEPAARRVPAFWGGLALGCCVSFLAFLIIATSPLSPLAHPDLSSSAKKGKEGDIGIYPRTHWGVGTRASHTAALIRQVQASAPEEIRDRCVEIIRGDEGSLSHSFSQASQDWLLFHNFFFYIPYGKGTYLDIGSNHPRDLSNTYFFDKCLGWRGVCVEPNPRYHPLYKEFNRTCTLVKHCIAGRRGKHTMNVGKGLHGRLGGHGAEVECVTLNSIVEHHKLSYADLATIDIEGFEFASLRCFPFRAHRIATWLVETDKATFDLFRLFIRGGYAYVGDILCPLRALHSDVTRVGVKLDSVFRQVSPSFIAGPSFLPGQIHQGQGGKGPCKAWSKGVEACPQQVPVIEVEEVHVENMTLKHDICEAPNLHESRPEFDVPTSHHPAIYRG